MEKREYFFHSRKMPLWIFVQTIEPFSSKFLEKYWSRRTKTCYQIYRTSYAQGDTTVRKFMEYICEEFFLFSVSMCGEDDTMMRQIIRGTITDDDIELQLGEFLEHTLLHGCLREPLGFVSRCFAMDDRVDNRDRDFLLLSIMQDISRESGSCDSFSVEFSHSLPMEYCSRTPIGE